MKKSTIELIDRIVECDERATELWEGRTKRSIKAEDNLRLKIRKIHELEDQLFVQLWEVLSDKEFDQFEEIERRDFENKIRYVYCDGGIHLEADKNGAFQHGSLCYC